MFELKSVMSQQQNLNLVWNLWIKLNMLDLSSAPLLFCHVCFCDCKTIYTMYWISEIHHIWSCKATWAILQRRHLRRRDSNIWPFYCDSEKSQAPENATDEDSRGQSHACLKVMFLCSVLLVYFVSAWVSNRVTWPVSSPRLCRRSRSQRRRRRC